MKSLISLLLFVGLFVGSMAPVIAAQAVLVSRLSPRDALAESFTWGATCLLGGISAGIAAGGLLAQHLAAGWILLTAGVSTALSGAIVWRSLRDNQP